MCGLVGMCGNLVADDAKVLKSMLFMDTIRGKHATGIALSGGLGYETEHFKMALPAPYFLEQSPTNQILSNFNLNVVAMGHNRHATKGNASDPAGAHPFVKGHITLMHNGSLTSHHSLTKESFTVDSEAIARAFEVDGHMAVIPKLRGAFALVWIDETEGTINFVRNDERPLAFAHCNGRMYWASEVGMLKWLLERPDSVFSDTPTRNVVSYEELPIGEVWSFQMTNTTVEFDTVTKTEVELAPKYYTQSYQGGQRYRGSSHQTKTTSTSNSAKKKSDNSTSSNSTTGITSNKTMVTQAVQNTTKRMERERHERNTKVIIGTEQVTDYSLGATREAAYAGLASLDVVERFCNQHHLIKTFIKCVDMGTAKNKVDDRIPFAFEKWVPYQGTSGTGYIVGHMIEAPKAEIRINAVTEKYAKDLVDNLGRLLSGYIQSIARPNDIVGGVNRVLSLAERKRFQLYLKSETIRRADLTNTNCSDFPAGYEDELEYIRYLGVKAQSKADKTRTSNASKAKVTEKKPKGADEEELCPIKKQTNEDCPSSSEQVSDEDITECVTGPQGEFMPINLWKSILAEGGCRSCGTSHVDIRSASLINWEVDNGTWLCPVCDFYIRNPDISTYH